MPTRADRITQRPPYPNVPVDVVYSDFDVTFSPHPDHHDIFRITNVNAVKKSLRNLIMTDPYERLFQPRLGCGVRAQLFELITGNSLSILKDTITSVIQTYEPRVALQAVTVTANPDGNSVLITIIFAILNIPGSHTASIVVDRVR